MKKALLFFLIILVSGEACIDPIDLQIDTPAEKLVVDGFISNLPGPYTIKISRSLPFDSKRVPPVYMVPEIKALVSIEDGQGNEVSLVEVSPGIYQTNKNDITGQVGEAYTLKITTENGRSYRSQPEIMPSVPPIESVVYKYKVFERLLTNSQGDPFVDQEYGFLLSVIVNDPTDERNYYRWKTNGIFEFFSINDNPQIKQCWGPLFRIENSITIKDDRYVNGNSFEHDVAIIPYTRETKFLAKVEQISLTQKAYEFWNDIVKQHSGTGSIFDPAPAQVRGNLYNPDDELEFVVGYFSASAIYKDSVLIDRFKASGFVSPSPRIPPIPGDCRTQEPGATNIKPPGF